MTEQKTGQAKDTKKTNDCCWLGDKIEIRFNAIPSAVVSASANTVGGVPVGREDDAAAAAAATADVVVVKLKQPLSPAELGKKQPKHSEKKNILHGISFELFSFMLHNIYFIFISQSSDFSFFFLFIRIYLLQHSNQVFFIEIYGFTRFIDTYLRIQTKNP